MSRRVVVLGPMPPLKGGIAQHTWQIVRGFRRLGWCADAVSWAQLYPSRLYGREQWDGSRENADASIDWYLRWWNPWTWWRAGRRARHADLCVLPYVHPIHAPAMRIAIAAARPTPVAVHVHNAIPHESFPMAERAARLVAGAADLVVCHARSIEAELRSVGFTGPVSIVAHPPDIDIQPSALPAGPIRLVHLGYLRDYKGADVLLDALPSVLLRHPEVRLTVAGEIWDGDETPWREQVDRLGVSDAVDFRFDYLDDLELVQALLDHHLLVAPYRSATQSGVVAMALAAGRPVVASAVGGLPDVVVDGKTGALAQPGDAVDLAAAICRAIDQLEDLARGASATGFRWEDVAAALAGAAG